MPAASTWSLSRPIDETFLALSPEEFIKHVLVHQFAPVHIVEGSNFFFGLCRSGSVATLRQAGQFEGWTVDQLDPVTVEIDGVPQRISSTLIRRFLRDGRVKEAARCLGRDYALYGAVVRGAGRGRLMGFPTANLDVDNQVVPADGVYAAQAVLGDKTFPAAVSIGNKPSLGPADRQFIEAHLIDADPGMGDLYDGKISLRFVDRLRDQQAFESVDALRAKISEDVQLVRRIFSESV